MERELASVRAPRCLVGEKWIDETLLTAEPGQEHHVDVARLPRLAPPLDGESTDNGGLPPVRVGEPLQVGCCCEEGVHARRR